MASVVRKNMPSFWDTSWSPAQLNAEMCLNLEKITSSFNSPITEEHAWAIVFECVKCLKDISENNNVSQSSKQKVFIVTNTQQIKIHREGRVHESTFTQDFEDSCIASKFFNGFFILLVTRTFRS